MNWRKIAAGAAAAVVLLAAVEVTRDKAPTSAIETTRLYPGFIERVNDVRRLAVRTREEQVVITGQGDEWVIENRGGFPARFARVKEALVQLAQLEVLETKTSMPEKYGQIGVADLETEGSTARLVTVQAESGAELIELLVGKERPGTGLTPPAHYVRRHGDGTALLVEGELELGARPNDWLDNAIVDVAADRVSRVTINPREGRPVVVAKVSRTDQFFDLKNVPEGHEARSKALVSSLGGLLLGVAFDDVAKAAAVEGLVPRTIVEVQTFDGLVVTLEEYDVEEKVYVKFAFAYNPDLVVAPAATDAGDAAADAGDEPTDGAAAEDKDAAPDVAAEAEALAEKVAGWVYVLPDYKVRLIDRELEDLIKPVEKQEDQAPVPE